MRMVEFCSFVLFAFWRMVVLNLMLLLFGYNRNAKIGERG